MYKLLDLYCGSGGATKGYQRAGFYVVGVDIAPQTHYCGDEFYQADALDFCREHGAEFDAIHASPPCQGYSVTRAIHKREYPMLIDDVRRALNDTCRVWVIENVIGSPLDGITLCGVMFGLKIYRHRIFESNVLLLQPPHLDHPDRVVETGRPVREGQYMTVAGHFSNINYAQRAMGIDWMTRDELAEAVPPAFAEYIGGWLMKYLTA